MSFTLREANVEDASTINDLVLALADYHGGKEKCKMDEDLIRRNIFQNKYAYCVLAIDDSNQEAAGFALYFYNFSTWTARRGIYLEDLYVKEEYRSQGIGKKFFGYLAQVAEKEDCYRLDLSVHSDNTKSKMFYQSIGGDVLNSWQSIRFENESLHNLCKLYDHDNNSNGTASNGIH